MNGERYMTRRPTLRLLRHGGFCLGGIDRLSATMRQVSESGLSF
jgi:hypothetical protein